MSKSRLDQATAALDLVLETLLTSASVVNEKILSAAEANGDYDDKLASHNCYLASNATTVVRELRQLEKHAKTMDENLSDEDLLDEMLARLEELPIEKRLAFGKAVTKMNKKKVV